MLLGEVADREVLVADDQSDLSLSSLASTLKTIWTCLLHCLGSIGLRKKPGCSEHRDHFYDAGSDAVDHPVGSDNHLSQILLLPFGHDSPRLWE